jgi:hypothetical protein
MPFVFDDDDDDDDNDAANVFSQLLMLSPCSALCQVFISVLCKSIPGKHVQFVSLFFFA